MKLRTRFAPSPTGYLHIGGVRTALFCWLYARRHNGEFLLRIEDTDRERSSQAAVDVILEAMDWLGLNSDADPVYQSQRLDRYRQVSEQLMASGNAYRCYCTPAELEKRRAEQKAAGLKPRYDGRCRDRQAMKSDLPHVIRFRNPDQGVVVVVDELHGDVAFDNAELDDLVLIRSDGMPTYNFSVVIDDSDMGVTHVIRGDDHLNNTPRQVNILSALGKPSPRYAHVPMILGHDGARLSKRHGSVNVLHYRDEGYLPEALLNYLVRLGWSHGDQEIFSLDELQRLFDLSDVNRSAATFDPDKLRWLNQHYIKQADNSRLASLLAEQFVRAGIVVDGGPALGDVVEAYRERADTLMEMAVNTRYLFEDFAGYDDKAARKHLKASSVEILKALADQLSAAKNWHAEDLENLVRDLATTRDVGLSKVAQPLRVALTGTAASPGIGVTLALVGQDRALRRLHRAAEYARA